MVFITQGRAEKTGTKNRGIPEAADGEGRSKKILKIGPVSHSIFQHLLTINIIAF